MSATERTLLDRLREAVTALRDVSAERDVLQRSAEQRSEPIAIVGVGCRFPGETSTPEEFFAFLRDGGDGVTEVPPERWSIAGNPDNAAASATRYGAFLGNVDGFDAAFFNIAPREASALDPQQRLLLEVTWEALERAGLPPASLVGSKTAVFVGVMTTDYLQLSVQEPPAGWDAYTATGASHCFPAGRLSYTFGFQGPSMVVDTACSSSLVATHLACQSLRNGESDHAIVGGVNLMLSPTTTELSARFNGLSPDGRCKSFDARANGYVRGEGCGVLVLKRLADAQADGNPILALIRGSHVNQDGRSSGLTAPNVLAQQALIREALRNAGVTPAEIDYVEAHGTGTSLGDPVEFEALRAVLDSGEARCVLGAVKSNIGHLEAAAGVAGLIKAVLALQHQQIPPNAHFRTLNPRISLADTRFVIPSRVVPWERGERTRRAGVSSFGLSGTNAHIILEEAPATPTTVPSSNARLRYLLPISARAPAALKELARAYADQLRSADSQPLEDVVYTASCRRTHHEYRLAVTGRTREELADALVQAAEELDEERLAPAVRSAQRARLAFVFPGQGSQWLGMGRQLLANEPSFSAALHVCDAAIQRFGGFSVVAQLTDDTASQLSDIGVLQPTLFAIQVALARLWQSWGVDPDVVVGHSMGEVAAAVIAERLSIEDGARVMCRRSALLRRVSGQGAMAVVELSQSEATQEVERYAGRLSLAVSNGPRSSVLAGDPAALEEVLATLEARGVFCRRVKVDVASHSPQMDPLRAELAAALSDVRSLPGRIAMRSTVTGSAVAAEQLDASYWVHNLRDPVLFSSVTQALLLEQHRIFLEISPHPVLIPAIEENIAETKLAGVGIASLRRNSDESDAMLSALGALYQAGYPVEWQRHYPQGGAVAQLPSYAWQREVHWLETTNRPALPSAVVRPAESEQLDGLLTLAWRPEALATAPASGANVLLLASAAHDYDALAHELRGHGCRCVVVRPGLALRALDVDSWEIEPSSAVEYDALLDAMVQQSPAAWTVIHALGAPDPSSAEADDLSRSLRLGYESVLLLSQALIRASATLDATLCIVTTHAVSTHEQEPVSVSQAPQWGLARTIHAEQPGLRCRLIDIDSELLRNEPSALCAELRATDSRENQVALRVGRRFVARLSTAQQLAAPPAPASFSAHGTYLVTGGLGGLGLALASWLVTCGVRTLVLAGRSQPSEQALAAMERMREAGAHVVCLSADVSCAEDMRAVFAWMDAELPAVRGVVHAAGVLADRTLLELSVDDLRKTAAAKIWGAWNLHQCTRGRTLDLFVLYASAAGLLGSAGQGNYAAANAFLDALALQRRAMGLPGLAIDWGAFSDTGLAAEATRSGRLAEMGFRSLTAQHGHSYLAALLKAPWAHAGVVPMDITRVVESMPLLANSPYFSELHSEQRVEASERAAVLAAPALERRSLLERLVRQQLSRVTRVPAQRIVECASFFDTGFDSLMALDLRNRLQAALSVRLTVSDIITRPFVASLAMLLDERLPAGSADNREPAPVAACAAVGSWVRTFAPRPTAKLRLFCFPYAGGAASIFSGWPETLADDIELCAIQFPGRQERAHEACISSVDALVAELVPALLPYLDRPFAVFGHCMGAIVMFETLRVLARQHGLHATQVFAAGAPPPHRYLAPRVTSGSQSEFKDVLSFIGFARPELLDDPEAERTLLAPVRNDFDAAAGYRYVEAEQLSAPILTFAGREDPFAPPSIVREWSRHTSGACSEVSLPGEHYFIVPERVPMLRIMNVELLLRLASISGVEAQVRSLHELPRRATSRARMRLFCFPGIGGNLAHFQALAAAVRSDIEVCGIELPGRGTMSSELPLGRVDELVARIVPALRGFLDLPYAFVGLNLGSAIMTEVARSLRRRGLPLPRQLFVGAAMAPQDCYLAPLHHLPGARLFETLQSFGLTLSQGQGVERILRADCAAAASYGYVEDAPLELPIAVFVGDRDRFIPRGSLGGWARHSTFPLTVTECQAGHDVLHGEALHVVLDAIHASCPVEQPRNVGREYRAMLSESAE